MNKKKTIKRLTASGALLVTLSPMAQTLVGVGEGVAHALRPSAEYPQTQFEADLAAYQTAKAQYDRDKAAYDAAKAKYDTDKAEYDKAKTAYDVAMAKYGQDKATYDAAKAEYDRAIADLGDNVAMDGNISRATGQALIFQDEPNATLSIQTNGVNNDGEVTLNQGQTATATYTNLQNSSYAGQTISKVVYTYTALDAQDIVNIHADPTVTATIKRPTSSIGQDSSVRMTAKFYGKFRVIQVLLMAQTPLHTGLAIFAVLTSVIAGYIHLRVVKVIYFDVEKRPANVQLQGRYGMHALLSINGALLVVFGILPAGLLYLCEQVVLNMLRHMSGMS